MNQSFIFRSFKLKKGQWKIIQSNHRKYIRVFLLLKGKCVLVVCSLHESGLSFNPERRFKLKSCLQGEIELRIERSRRTKISFRVETRFRFMYQQSYFSGDFSIYTPKYVNKTSHFANNLYFGHNERRFHCEFHWRVKFRSKFTWFRIDISFRIECSIRNEKWNELDPEWVATQSGFM